DCPRAAQRTSRVYFNLAPTPEIYTLSLHDALPICRHEQRRNRPGGRRMCLQRDDERQPDDRAVQDARDLARTEVGGDRAAGTSRSEEHTSELQSRRDLVCRLLLEKKKRK